VGAAAFAALRSSDGPGGAAADCLCNFVTSNAETRCCYAGYPQRIRLCFHGRSRLSSNWRKLSRARGVRPANDVEHRTRSHQRSNNSIRSRSPVQPRNLARSWRPAHCFHRLRATVRQHQQITKPLFTGWPSFSEPGIDLDGILTHRSHQNRPGKRYP
jgi:hypothetical protein